MGVVLGSGVVALVSIAGLGWMGSSFFEGNRAEIVGGISSIVQARPWLFAVGLFSYQKSARTFVDTV